MLSSPSTSILTMTRGGLEPDARRGSRRAATPSRNAARSNVGIDSGRCCCAPTPATLSVAPKPHS